MRLSLCDFLVVLIHIVSYSANYDLNSSRVCVSERPDYIGNYLIKYCYTYTPLAVGSNRNSK